MALRESRFALCLIAALAVADLRAATFTVNSTADTSDATPGDALCDAGGSVCTLRAAIEEANANAGPDAIHFAIGTGPQTIAVTSLLPDITETVTIDGTTQPGYSATPLIEIDGFAALGGNGLNLPAVNASVIRALLINRFDGHGVWLGGNGNTVELCHIGTDATKTVNRGNAGNGIAILAGDNNLIRYNTIAFNSINGVGIFDGEVFSFPLFTALTPDHTAIFPSIDFTDGCSNFRHSSGGSIVDTSGRAFNEYFGMRLTATMSIPTSGSYNFAFTELDDYGRLVIDSVEELSITGPGPNNVNVNLSAGDHSFEVGFWEGAGASRLLMTINGPGTPTFNFSGNPGLQGELFQSRVAAEGNRVSQNAIFDNGSQGIALSCCCRDINDAGDIDVGPNTFLNYPVFTNAFVNQNGSITVQGTAPVGSYVEVFASTNDTTPPSLGFGEGKLYLTTSAIVGGDGNFIATFNLPAEYYSVTATATDASNNTSEFAENFAVRPREVQVTNTNDDGPGSLRAAILDANTDGVETLISFDPLLSGGSITLNTSLPNLTENGTTINGDINGDCKPDIELRGDGGAQSGVTLQSSGNTIRGLALNRFATVAIVFEGAPATNNQVVCNFLGTNLAGTAAINGGLHGIAVNNGAASNQIGTLSGRNVIGLFGVHGIWISNSDNNVVAGNIIGLDVTGTLPIPSLIGVQLTNANGTFIGPAGEGNRIVAVNGGIDVSGGTLHRIWGNTIGWPSASTPSTGYGMRFSAGASQATVGGTAPGEANHIENNGGSGILVESGSTSIHIGANVISGNGALGIDLGGNGVSPNDANDADGGANLGQNFPVLTRAVTTGSSTNVDGFLDSPVIGGNYIIDFYVSSAPDPSGYGEGATHLFSLGTPPGTFTAALPAVPAGSWITATATANVAGNTSEFSLARQASGPPLGATELVAFPVLPTSIELRWRDPQSSETGFRIERRADGGGFGPVTNVGPDTTTFVDTSVPPGTQVWYRVIATSAGGDAPASNIATARAFHNVAQQTCRMRVNQGNQQARASSVAWNGTNWAIAWEDTRNGRESDIYFQFLNTADGTPIGSPIQITNDDVASRFPTLTWNGTNYGLLWHDHIRQPNGDVKSRISFALLGPTGTKIRGDVKVISNLTAASLNLDGTTSLVWDGNGWGVFLQEAVGSPADVVFYRLDPDGDVLVNGVQITNTPAVEGEFSAAWNGTAYAVAWLEQLSPTSSTIRFQLLQTNGSVIPPQRSLWNNPNVSFGTSLIWDGTGWAVAWTDIVSADRVVQLIRVSADASSLGPVVRLSDDGAVLDQLPKLFVKPGGGYVAYTESQTPSGVFEIGRLEADANGARVGSRTLVSPDDGFDSQFPRAAASGTDFLLSWQESRVNQIEVATAVVSAAGVAGAANDITTTHTPPFFASQPVVIPMLNQFVTLWNSAYNGTNQLHAKILRSDGSFVDRRPLNNADSLRRVAAVSYGSRFAVAWADRSTGELRFDRFDNNGNSQLGGGVQVTVGVNTPRGTGLAYSGEFFGIVYSQANILKFQRMDDNAPVGGATSISVNPGNDPQIQWVGNGWAVVWRSNSNLYFARLDPTGATVIPPTQVTDTFANPSTFELLWTGEHLGLVWAESHNTVNPASDIFFTVLDLNGFKTFAPVTVASTQFIDRLPALIWDGTNFRVLYPDYAMGIRDIGVTATGSVLPSPRFHGNHGEGQLSAAFNGATLALGWIHLTDVLFQTSGCLADVTPPSCTTLNGTFASGAVQLSWSPASDAQSGILAYHVYRDGKLLTELVPNATSYTDGGFTPGAVHTYELRAFNGAYLEATGCTPKNVTAGIEVLPPTLPNARQGTSYLQMFTAPQGTGNSTYAVTSGALPAGLALGGPGNHNLSGNPSTVGVSNFTITATDTLGATGSRAYTLRVCPNTTIVPTVFPDPILNSPYSQGITLRGTSDTFTAAVTSGSLPPGLTLAANGTLSGTPTAAGAFNFTVTVTESTSCATSQSYSFTVLTGKAPRNVRALGQSSSSILVQWDLPQHGETGFRVERSFDAISWGAINNVGSDVTSHLDSGLTSATLYYYRVVAFSGALDSATSNVTAATTFPLGPTKICQQSIGPYHSRAQAISLAHTGTQWAAVWQDRRDNLNEELHFQFLDNTTGVPSGAPMRITTTDMLTRFPMLRWNGSQFGVLYTENMRGPSGQLTSTTSFALLDATGAVLRAGVPVYTTTGGFLSPVLDFPFVWDGGGWGVFASEARGNPPADLYYWRLGPSGDVVTGPVRLTTGAGWESDISAAWNGTEYGLAWVERDDTGANRNIRFQRMQLNGTLIGSPVTLDSTVPPSLAFLPNVAWNAGANEWAVAWLHLTGESIVKLRLLNPDGSPKGAAVRISDDPSINPAQPIDDDLPLVFPRASGGYHVFTASFQYTTSNADLARLQADAAGNRVGSRVYLTPADALGTSVLRAATDGTRFMLGYDDGGPAQMEAANVIVDAAGAVTNGPTPVTTGHGAGSSASPILVPLGAGFAAIWNESGATSQLRAKIYDGGGNLTSTKTPLSPSTGVRSRVGAVGVGNTFAVAWRDTTNLRFGRFDGAGNPLISEVVLPTGGNQAGLAWNGEHYGLVFYEGNSLRFQKLNADGTLNGPKVAVGDGTSAQAPQMVWAGSGWAIVWRLNADLYFALLDRNGAYLVPPLRVTFTPLNENNPSIAWSGNELGLVWNETRGSDPPGNDVWFTVLGLDGTKAFAEINLVSTPYNDGPASIYWAGDRFRIVHANALGGVRELAVQANGTVIGGQRVYHNRNFPMNIAFNGVTLGMLFSIDDLSLQTSACFDDVTAPPCPNLSTNFNGQRVRLTWPNVSDPDSGILGFNVYRDGAQLAELSATTTLFDDKGFVPGATHVYELRSINRAYLESSACTTRTVVAGINVTPLTLANGNVGSNFNSTFIAQQGTPPYTFAVTAGALPPGLALGGPGNQNLSGNPTTAGLYNFTITATDSLGATGSRAYALRICSGISLFPTVLADGYLSTAYSQTIVTSGAVGGVTLSITAGAFPSGLAMDATGWINGTPTTTGTFNVTIAATDSLGCTASRAYAIVIGTGAAVRNLSAFATSASAIRLRWRDPQRNETGFRIERSTDLGANWAPFTIVGGDVTTYTDSGLTAGTTYSYRVIATTPAGDAPASNIGTASTFPATAAKACIQQVTPGHTFARFPSPVYTGTQWAMAYTDRLSGEEDEIYFTFLNSSGVPTGTPLRITDNDTIVSRATLRWNGTHFGVMWFEALKGSGGEPINGLRFALIDAAGNIVRRDVRVPLPDALGSASSEINFHWDGSAWGLLEARGTTSGFIDLFFLRLDLDGDLLAGPFQLTTDADFDGQASLAWNGTEYGMSWTRFGATTTTLFFQRFSAAGALIGSPTVLTSSTTSAPNFPDVVATPGGGWAVAWSESPDENSIAVFLRRLDAAGSPLGAATRLSDDFDLNGFTLAQQMPVSDNFQDLWALPGGGYVVFTRASLNATFRQEIGLLRADASGVSLGPRTILSTQDLFHSGSTRIAFDGTNFLATYNEHRLGTQEMASLIVSQSGAIVTGPTDISAGHGPGNNIGITSSNQPQLAMVGGGFAALWSEPVTPTENRIYAKTFDGTGALTATRSPLFASSARGRAGVIGVGSTFATAWKDNPNNVVFGRWDATGNPLITPVNIATGAGGPAGVSVGFDGEHYGLLWNQGGRLNFQRVNAAGGLIGARSTLAPSIVNFNVIQQMLWTGSGWAIVFITDNDVYYALLDINGAIAVPPIRVTFTPTESKEGLAIAWSGDVVGIAFANRPPVDPPGLVVNFTTVDLQGIKQFPERSISEGRFDNTLQGLNWDADHFRLAFVPGESFTLREIDISPTGTLLGASRMLSNRGGAASVVWNGATAGVFWGQLTELFFETTACLADTTPPTCPTISATRSSGPVTLTWTPSTDAESGIYRYVIYRDGLHIGEAYGTTDFDAGVRGSDQPTYRVAGVNGAYLESAGCVTVVPVAAPASLVATATSPTNVNLTWLAAAGATSYDVERSSNGTTYSIIGTSPVPSYADTSVVAARSYLYRVRAIIGTSTSAPSNIDLATTVLFTDDPLVAGVTVVKAIHLTEMRTAVNAMRTTLSGLPAATWTDASSPGTIARAVHITELRTALNQARAAVSLPTLIFTDTLTPATLIKAIHTQEVRNGVR